jgi:hypothetical protein
MTRTTRLVVGLLIAVFLLGGYLIVARNGPADSAGDTSSGFAH